MLEAVAAELIERKALDLILDNATYEDVGVGEKSQPGLVTVEEQTVPGPTEFLEFGLCLLLFGNGTGDLSPLPGHGGQVLYFRYVLLFIPGLLGAQEGLFSFA